MYVYVNYPFFHHSDIPYDLAKLFEGHIFLYILPISYYMVLYSNADYEMIIYC